MGQVARNIGFITSNDLKRKSEKRKKWKNITNQSRNCKPKKKKIIFGEKSNSLYFYKIIFQEILWYILFLFILDILQIKTVKPKFWHKKKNLFLDPNIIS